MEDTLLGIRQKPALQQPHWDRQEQLTQVRRELATRPPLVGAAEVRALRAALAEVALGRAQLVQAGDCAEDPEESTARDVHRKAALLDLLAGTMKMAAHRPVVRVGRLAGQFAKPRSRATETVGGAELPSTAAIWSTARRPTRLPAGPIRCGC